MNKKKLYITPTTECLSFDFEPFMITMSPRPNGYAIDNDDADDSNIIPIAEQGELDDDDPGLWGDGFIDID